MKKLLFLSALTAFDNSPGWLLDSEGHMVVRDGNPVYVDTAGREKAFEHNAISGLNREAQLHREEKQAAVAALKKFDGIKDPELAIKALETVARLDAKTLIDSGEVEKVKDTIRSEFTDQLTASNAVNKDLQSRIDGSRIKDVFTSSTFVNKNIAVPRDMFEASFRDNFKIENDELISRGKDGNRLMSKEKPGEYASPEEALRLLVDAHPQKDVIMKADSGNGTGGDGNGGHNPNKRVITRAEFDLLTPADQAATSVKVNAKEITLTD